MTSQDPTFKLNGADVELTGADPTESLLRWLKRAQLHGTKEGCADGDCGACTVALVDVGADGRARYQAVNSCLLPVGFLPGREVVTVEALAARAAPDVTTLHPVQRALVDHAGSQCGYCTPGFVMSLFAGYYDDGALEDATIEGNLCRCTGYQPIRAAAAELTAQPRVDDRFAQALRARRAAPGAAALPRFASPTTVAEAIAAKQANPRAQWIAGATDLGVELSHDRRVEEAFVALDRVAELRAIDVASDMVRIGAGVTLARLEAELHGTFASLDAMIPWFAGRQVRNRATLGGNLGSASPIGDLLPVLLALEATVQLAGPNGLRTVAIDDYFIAYRKTQRADDELIVAVEIPRRASRIERSYKVAKRQTDDISIVAAAFAIERDASARVTRARLAYGGVAALPIRAKRAEAALLEGASIEEIRAILREEFTPLSDHRSGADYRRALAANLFAKFAQEIAL